MDNVNSAATSNRFQRPDRACTVLYASLKAIHLLAIVAWVGGMAFVLLCLRPAAAVLDSSARVTLMHAALSRFITVVVLAAALAFVSGAAMVSIAWSASTRAGLAFNMPLDWYAMIGLFFVMLVVFIHIRMVLFDRLSRSVAAKRWAEKQARIHGRSGAQCAVTDWRHGAGSAHGG